VPCSVLKYLRIRCNEFLRHCILLQSIEGNPIPSVGLYSLKTKQPDNLPMIINWDMTLQPGGKWIFRCASHSANHSVVVLSYARRLLVAWLSVIPRIG